MRITFKATSYGSQEVLDRCITRSRKGLVVEPHHLLAAFSFKLHTQSEEPACVVIIIFMSKVVISKVQNGLTCSEFEWLQAGHENICTRSRRFSIQCRNTIHQSEELCLLGYIVVESVATRCIRLYGRRTNQAKNLQEAGSHGGDMFLRNFGWLSTDYTGLYPRRQNPT
jgi:hypothetical protein